MKRIAIEEHFTTLGYQGHLCPARSRNHLFPARFAESPDATR